MLDGPKAIADYLAGIPGVPRVLPGTPDDTDDPWVRLTQLDAPSATPPVDHLIQFMIQLDCYAGLDGKHRDAKAIAVAVREALKAMPGTHGDVVVTGVECVGDAYLPDTDFNPARPRYALTFYVWIHER